MTALVDINVLLDVILRREPWHEAAAALLSEIERGRIEAFVAGHTIPTIHYVVARARDRATAAGAVTELLRLVDVVPVGREDYRRALVLPVKDFEDAVQVAAAMKIDAACIVTRNERDFRGSPVRALRPEALLAP